jgi:hypothetical protein
VMSTLFPAQSDAAVSDLRAWSENQFIAAAKSERSRDQLHDENVVLRQQIRSSVHVRSDRRHLVGVAGTAFSASESSSHRFERSC